MGSRCPSLLLDVGVDTEDCVDEGAEGEEVGHTPYRVGRARWRIP